MPRIPGLPIVGNLLSLRRDRVGFQLEAARRYERLARIQMGLAPFPVLMVNAPELVGEVLVDNADAFHKTPGLAVFGRPLLGRGLLTSEGDVHKRQRRMMAPMFVQKRIAAFADVMAAYAARATERLPPGGIVDFADETMRVTLEIVAKTLFDTEVDGAEAREIGEALTECLEYIIGAVQNLVPLPPAVPTPANLRYKRAVARLDRTIFRMIADRRASGRDHGDLLSMLLAARDEESRDGMDDQQVRDELMTIFLAGHETTANALAWTFYLLSRHPEVRERVHAEVDGALQGRLPGLADLPKLPYTLQVFKESMRLYPPAYVLGRQATRDVTIGGHLLKKGTVAMINIIGIHRSARHFVDPERFDPSRFTPEQEKKLPRHTYMPFGAGSRICIGNHFALMEGHLLLATFAQRVQLDLLAGAELTPEPLVTLRPRGGMPMRVTRRG